MEDRPLIFIPILRSPARQQGTRRKGLSRHAGRPRIEERGANFSQTHRSTHTKAHFLVIYQPIQDHVMEEKHS